MKRPGGRVLARAPEVSNIGRLGNEFWASGDRKLVAEKVTDFGRAARVAARNGAAGWGWDTPPRWRVTKGWTRVESVRILFSWSRRRRQFEAAVGAGGCGGGVRLRLG